VIAIVGSAYSKKSFPQLPILRALRTELASRYISIDIRIRSNTLSPEDLVLLLGAGSGQRDTPAGSTRWQWPARTALPAEANQAGGQWFPGRCLLGKASALPFSSSVSQNQESGKNRYVGGGGNAL